MSSVVVAGAGLGALRVAESLRANGFAGQITAVGDEPFLPYTRPPLSKEALATGVGFDGLEFRRRKEVGDVTWRLGVAIASADLQSQIVTLDDGSTLPFDGLAVATGIRARELEIPGPRAGRLRLRTLADAIALRECLISGGNILVLGAGFIGCEVAATARTLGCNVHVVALDAEPMIGALGATLGAAMRRRHEQHGVRFHLGMTVDAFHGSESVLAATLSNGTELQADVVVEAVGSVPNVAWLEGNGLDLSDGLLVDDGMRVLGSPAPTVAAGDVARHPNALFPGVVRRVEHWAMPTETGRRAGRTLASLLAGQDAGSEPFAVLPSFWSDQYEHQVQSFGLPDLAPDAVLVDAGPDEPCIATYFDDSGLVGVVGIDRTADLMDYRNALLARGRDRE